MIAAIVCAIVLLGAPQQVVVEGGPPPNIAPHAPLDPNAPPATLPETPQGRHVKAYLDAFNSGDEQAFLKAQDAHMSPDALAKRPAADRARMFKRMRGDFGKIKVGLVAKSTASEIQVIAPAADGDEAAFIFSFEPQAPFRIVQIAVDIQRRER